MPEQLDFEILPRYQKREFVPEAADLTDLNTTKGLCQQLLDRVISSSEALEKWILDRSELDVVYSETKSVLYIRMTCQTDNKAIADAYTYFIQNITPAIQPLDDKLNKKYMELIEQYPLSEERYGLYIKAIKTDIEIFSEKNVEAKTRVSLLSQEYQTVSAAMTVDLDGEEKTLPQMSKYLENTNRNVREKAWRAIAERRMVDKNRLEEIFGKMLQLRHQISLNAGFDNFRDYMFKRMHRFDYTPNDCEQYHTSIEKLVVPLWKKVLGLRKNDLGVDQLRPWDLHVDTKGRPPLKPFTEVDELVNGCTNIFKNINKGLGGQFESMANEGLLDLDSRKGKAPGGYQSSLNEARKPFIFMNAVGVDGDVRTLLHEAGHAFHSLACSNEPIINYRHAPMEFNEVASMSMELLGDRYLNEFYSQEDAKRSQCSHFEGIIYVLVWVAIVDAFQHWIYLNPEKNSEQRCAQWLVLLDRFNGGVVDFSGMQEIQKYSWHRQLHIFEVPFYYIEYGIAQLGALQLWKNSKNDWDKTLRQYCDALALGGVKPLPEIYKTAGICFDFSKNTISPLMEAVELMLEKL